MLRYRRGLVSFLALIVLATCLAGTLTACGRKGVLKDPPNSEYPKKYPAE